MQSTFKNMRFFFGLIPFLFWVVFLIVFFNASKTTIFTLKSIANLDSRFYQVEVQSNNLPKYSEVKVKPKTWVTLNEISKKAVGAIVVSEDGKFFLHHGYDIEQIQKVIALKVIAKKKHVRGASTITQQLIKNLYLSKEKSVSRKIKEFYYANFIEDKVSKNKILETYLNVIEYGQGIYGIENAAQFYFKKSAKNLNAKEGAFLAMLLPSPIKYARSFKQKSLTPFAKGIIESILLKMKVSGYIGEEEMNQMISTPLSFEGQSMSLKNAEEINSLEDESIEDLKNNNENADDFI